MTTIARLRKTQTIYNTFWHIALRITAYRIAILRRLWHNERHNLNTFRQKDLGKETIIKNKKGENFFSPFLFS